MMPDVKCRSCWSDTLSTSFKALQHMWSSAVSGSPGLYLQLSCAVCRFPCLRPSFSVWTHELHERWSIDVNCLRVRGSNLQGFYAVKHPWQKVRIGRYVCKIMQVYNTTTYITTAFSPYFYKDPMSTSLYTDLQPCVLVSQSRFVCWYYFSLRLMASELPLMWLHAWSILDKPFSPAGRPCFLGNEHKHAICRLHVFVVHLCILVLLHLVIGP